MAGLGGIRGIWWGTAGTKGGHWGWMMCLSMVRVIQRNRTTIGNTHTHKHADTHRHRQTDRHRQTNRHGHSQKDIPINTHMLILTPHIWSLAMRIGFCGHGGWESQDLLFAKLENNERIQSVSKACEPGVLRNLRWFLWWWIIIKQGHIIHLNPSAYGQLPLCFFAMLWAERSLLLGSGSMLFGISSYQNGELTRFLLFNEDALL